MKFGALILILGILFIGAGIYLLATQNPSSGANNIIPNTIGNGNNSQSTSPPAGSSGTPQTYNINIQNFAFSPSSLTIKPGDTVIWTNKDSMSHTVTSDSGNELISSTINNGGTYSHVFSTAGTFAYHCSIHTSMKGTIIVQ